MDNDSQAFDPERPASSAATSSGLDRTPGLAPDAVADIGYEAADPSLQTPLWCAAMQGRATERGGP